MTAASSNPGAQEEATPRKGEVKLHVDLKRAQRAAERGDQAEAAGKIDEALLHYQEAVVYAPKDMAYALKEAALRSKLVRTHVDAAERAALEGRMEKATEELRKALHIDPGNTIVAERMAQMKSMDDEPPTTAQMQITGLPKMQPTAGKQDLNLRGETRSVYEELGARFGIKASFDPDVMGRASAFACAGRGFLYRADVIGNADRHLLAPAESHSDLCGSRHSGKAPLVCAGSATGFPVVGLRGA